MTSVNKRLQLLFRISIWAMLLPAMLASCISDQNKPILLSSFTENDVEVSISLLQETDDRYVLTATFVPPEGYHLYGKDIPVQGIDGVGRPTLLTLTSSSLLKAAGILRESATAEEPDFEPRELRVYPAGAVTLSLPVELPPGEEWLEDQISVTYMACSPTICKPPVVGKVVKVRIPGADIADAR